jgi:cation transporter-like permease
MDIVLLTLTTLSLVAAAGFGLLSWRIGREQRQREQARVAALATAMTSPSIVRGTAFSSEADTATQVAVGSLFERATEGLRGRPAIKAAVIAAMVVTIVVGAMIGARMSDNAAASAKPTRNELVATNAAAPLELMSMRHQRQGTTLTVSGLVRNPSQGVAMSGITAVLFAFDRTGAFIASGRAALDLTALGPGDESPFVVNIPNALDVARYRVTFRSGSGVVRHIDRRGNQVQLAQAVR